MIKQRNALEAVASGDIDRINHDRWNGLSLPLATPRVYDSLDHDLQLNYLTAFPSEDEILVRALISTIEATRASGLLVNALQVRFAFCTYPSSIQLTSLIFRLLP